MPRVGLYPGTFDPFTNGHTDIIGRAVKLLDKLVIGVARNDSKGPMFSFDERVAIVREEVDLVRGSTVVEVVPFEGLLVHFAREMGADVIVRGLRSVQDFEYEYQMTAMNHEMAPDIDTIFLFAAPRHQAISSSLVKVIAQLGGDASKFVSPRVLARLLEKVRPA